MKCVDLIQTHLLMVFNNDNVRQTALGFECEISNLNDFPVKLVKGMQVANLIYSETNSQCNSIQGTSNNILDSATNKVENNVSNDKGIKRTDSNAVKTENDIIVDKNYKSEDNFAKTSDSSRPSQDLDVGNLKRDFNPRMRQSSYFSPRNSKNKLLNIGVITTNTNMNIKENISPVNNSNSEQSLNKTSPKSFNKNNFTVPSIQPNVTLGNNSKNLVSKSLVLYVEKTFCGVCNNPTFTNAICYSCGDLSQSFTNNKNVREQSLAKADNLRMQCLPENNNEYLTSINKPVISVAANKQIETISKFVNKNVDNKLDTSEKRESVCLTKQDILLDPNLIKTDAQIYKHKSGINYITQTNTDKVSSEKCQVIAETLKPLNENIDCFETRNPSKISVSGDQILLPPVTAIKNLKNEKLERKINELLNVSDIIIK